MGRRLRDVYLAIYTFLVTTWFVKLLFHSTVTEQQCLSSPTTRIALEDAVDRYMKYLPSCEADTFLRHAAVGPIPGLVVIMAVLTFYVGLLALVMLTYSSHDTSVEVLSRERTLQKLVSPTQQPVHKSPWQAALMGGEFFDHPLGPSDLED
ncbi:MAG TPA: DUF2270 domain-containing protein, partial [Roseiflexaceae bacterium]|nr:DUF2270 domain-containing protein [Roseiflexaceae bacterium]